MFEGIIRFLGLITNTINGPEGFSAMIETNKVLCDQLAIGDSVACAGACLTIIDKNAKNQLTFEISSETLARTNFQLWKVGQKINLEPPLRYGQPISGHIIQGHVDCTAKVLTIEEAQGHCLLTISAPIDYMEYIAPKGCICLDGVSLTINTIHEDRFAVNIIPFTWENTTFKWISTGSLLNMEVDILARYLINSQKMSTNHKDIVRNALNAKKIVENLHK